MSGLSRDLLGVAGTANQYRLYRSRRWRSKIDPSRTLEDLLRLSYPTVLLIMYVITTLYPKHGRRDVRKWWKCQGLGPALGYRFGHVTTGYFLCASENRLDSTTNNSPKLCFFRSFLSIQFWPGRTTSTSF